jgi:AraC-like DNA-binding protein
MVVRGLQSQSTAQWTNLALESGYFDQSHFIHDFREFSGVTPREYIGLRTPHVNHLQHPA